MFKVLQNVVNLKNGSIIGYQEQLLRHVQTFLVVLLLKKLTHDILRVRNGLSGNLRYLGSLTYFSQQKFSFHWNYSWLLVFWKSNTRSSVSSYLSIRLAACLHQHILFNIGSNTLHWFPSKRRNIIKGALMRGAETYFSIFWRLNLQCNCCPNLIDAMGFMRIGT